MLLAPALRASVSVSAALALASLVGAQDGVWIVDGPPVRDSGFLAISQLASDGNSIRDHEVEVLTGIATHDRFGVALAPLGDLDGDGVGDWAVASRRSFPPTGITIWLAFMNAGGALHARSVLVTLPTVSCASCLALSALGDLDGDGGPELAYGTADAGVTVLFLDHDGTIKTSTLLDEGVGGFTGDLDPGDQFGAALARLDDMDGDGVPELAIGAPEDVGSRGAIWIVFLQQDGSAKAQQKIEFAAADLFESCGRALAPLGDLDGDGVGDLGVQSDTHLRVVRLNPDGTAKSETVTRGGGSALAPLGDLDGDGRLELAMVQTLTPFARVETLNADGTLASIHTSNLLGPVAVRGDPVSIAALPDIDGNGVIDVLIGCPSGDGSPPGTRTCVTEAIHDAGEGDVIVIGAGDYLEGVQIDGKSLTLVAEPGQVELTSPRSANSIRNLSAAQSVRVRGLDFVDSALNPLMYSLRPAMEAEDNAGPIWFEDCTIDRETDAAGGSGDPGLGVSSCASVALLDTDIEGQRHASPSIFCEKGRGCISDSSALFAYGTTFTPGWSTGLLLSNGLAALSACTVDSASGYCYCACLNAFPNATAWLVDSLLAPRCAVPETNGDVRTLGGESMSVSSPAVVREGELTTFTFQGPPSVPVWVALGPRSAGQFFREYRGSLLVGAPLKLNFLGTTDVSGTLVWSQPFPSLAPGKESVTLFGQSIYRDASGRFILGDATMLVALDSSF